jgi:hypothetical protein
MLNEQLREVNEAIVIAASRVGNNAPKVADEILEAVFPRTCAEAHHEGAYSILRRGFIGHVSRILRQNACDENQHDFAEKEPQFGLLVKELRSSSYYVESAQEYVSIQGLIDEPDLLDDARKFMRRKGEECIAEAERLDLLYQEVTATREADAAAFQVLV